MEFENQLKIGIGIYTPTEISRILRIPAYKVHRWINKYWDGELGKEYEAQYSWQTENSKAVGFHTLIEFYVMGCLADQGLSTRKVLNAHKILSEKYKTAFPFAQKDILAGLKTDGKNIFLKSEEILMTLDGTNQLNLNFIAVFFKNLEFDGNNIASRFYPLGKDKSIIVDPKRKFGHPLVAENNIYPETFFGLYQGGESVEYIAYLYEVEPKHVQDAIDFCNAA